MNKYSRILGFTAAILVVSGLSCGQSGGVQEITETRLATRPHPPVDPNQTSVERFFGVSASQDLPAAVSQAAAAFEWTTPPGWKSLPPAPMRDINMAAGDPPLVECYVTALPSAGGGLEANVNRWRQQMNLAPDTAENIGALPQVNVLGQSASLVELDGTYSGMRGDEQSPDYKMLAAFVPDNDRAVTIKMVGPAVQVEQEKDNFDTFIQSLRNRDSEQTEMAQAEPSDPPATEPEPEQAEPEGEWAEDRAGGLHFDVPTSWERGGERPMRLVTYAIDETGETECYISGLSGTGGGIEANINRWLQQMGQPELDTAGIEALPKIKVLESDVPMVEAAGEYTDMRGGTKPDYALLGVFVIYGDASYSVKLIGPAEDVSANKEAFIRFCESLHVD